jgi:hypothetical protein
MSGPGEQLQVRAHVPPPEQDPTGRRPGSRAQYSRARSGDAALVIHVLADDRDELLIATAREVELTATGPVTISERLYAPPEDVEALRAEVAGCWPDVEPGLGASPLTVEPVEMLGQLICKRGYRQRWPQVGYDLAWVLGRLAVHTGRSRSRRRGRTGQPAPAAADGFSIRLAGTGVHKPSDGWVSSWDYPTLIARPHGVGRPGAFFSWSPPKDKGARTRVDRDAVFLSLGELASAVIGADISGPADACAAFNLPWPFGELALVERLRAEAAAVVSLHARLVAALGQVAPGMRPSDARTFGSIATDGLTRAHIVPPLEKASEVPDADLGAAASASHGGRFEARIVGVALRAVLVDIASTYPRVFSLLNLTRVYSAGALRSVDRDPAELRGVLGDHRLWLDPALWREWGLSFATIRPHGEPLPAHLLHAELRVAPLELSGGSLTFLVTDLAAAIAEGANPSSFDIERVFAITPVGVQPGLRALRLPSGRTVDLTTEDLGAALIADRQAASRQAEAWVAQETKAVGNVHTFGSLARADRQTLTAAVRAHAVGPHGETLTVRTRHPETPGPYQFLPASAAVQAGARLLMALLRRLVVDAGSEIIAMHADSAAIPCATNGGQAHVPGAPNDRLRLLTPDELDAILTLFDGLRVQFKTEVAPTEGGRPVTALALGVNRVIFATEGPDGWEVLRSSDAGLGGHLADPSNHPGQHLPDGRWAWSAECERAIIAAAAAQPVRPDRGLSLGIQPDWVDRPPVRRYAANSHSALCALRAQTGDATVMPFARYLRVDVSGRRGGPVALGPWPEASRWSEADWRVDGEPVDLDTLDEHDGIRAYTTNGHPRRVTIKRVRDHLDEWTNRHAPSMLGPRRGYRQPAPVRSAPGLITVVGKDGTELDALDDDPSTVTSAEHLLVYGPAGIDQLRQRARDVGLRKLARHTHLGYEGLQHWAAGRTNTTPGRLARMGEAITQLEALQAAAALPACQHCGKPARKKWCGDPCRKAAARAAERAKHPRRDP